MLTTVLNKLRIADVGKLPLLESKMGLEQLAEFLGGRLQLVEVATAIVPDIRDFEGDIKDRLVRGVKLWLIDFEVVAPCDELLEGQLGQAIYAATSLGRRLGRDVPIRRYRTIRLKQ